MENTNRNSVYEDEILEKISILRNKLCKCVEEFQNCNDFVKEASYDKPSMIRFKNIIDEARDVLNDFQQNWEDLIDLHCIIGKDSDIPRDNDEEMMNSSLRHHNYDDLSNNIDEKANYDGSFPPTSSRSNALHAMISRSREKITHLVDIGAFDGELNKWENYRDKFINQVHKNDRFTDSEKLIYLLKSLSGEPLESIRSVMDKSQYDVAWAFIKEKYDNLLNSATYETKPENFEPFSQEHNKIMTQSIFKDSEEKVTIFHKSNLGKTEEVITFKFTVQTVTPDSSESDKTFMDSLPNCSGLGTLVKERCKIWDTTFDDGNKFLQSTTSALSFVCQKKHYVLKCPTYLNSSVLDRHELLKKVDNFCNICLQTGHDRETCESSKNCAKCKERHHTTLCLNEST